MKMRNNGKFEDGLTCQFKIDVRNSTHFPASPQKSQQFALNGLLLTKVYNVWAKKV